MVISSLPSLTLPALTMFLSSLMLLTSPSLLICCCSSSSFEFNDDDSTVVDDGDDDAGDFSNAAQLSMFATFCTLFGDWT